jgi:hypothetical protein
MDVFSLWLPILVSSLVVFFASFLAWMVLPHHKADIKALPDEQAMIDSIEKLNPPPGTYMWPNLRPGETMQSETFKARYASGPWGSLNVCAAQPNFGMNLALSFTLYVAISTGVAYVTGTARPAGAGFMDIFPLASGAAILAYCAGAIPGGLFMGKPARFMLTDFIDSAVYALLTALVFAWMWPAAAVATIGG